jgi:hypothetical protein
MIRGGLVPYIDSIISKASLLEDYLWLSHFYFSMPYREIVGQSLPLFRTCLSLARGYTTRNSHQQTGSSLVLMSRSVSIPIWWRLPLGLDLTVVLVRFVL